MDIFTKYEEVPVAELLKLDACLALDAGIAKHILGLTPICYGENWAPDGCDTLVVEPFSEESIWEQYNVNNIWTWCWGAHNLEGPSEDDMVYDSEWDDEPEGYYSDKIKFFEVTSLNDKHRLERLPHYSKDLGAIMEVVDKVSEQFWISKVPKSDLGGTTLYRARIGLPDKLVATCFGENVAETICKALLQSKFSK